MQEYRILHTLFKPLRNINTLCAAPLAAQMTVTGTSEDGRRLFHSPTLSTNGLSCGHCHSDFDEETRSDGLIRASHSLYNAYYRETWWGKDPEEPDAYATIDEAAVVCVLHYMRNKEKMTAQRHLYLRAYLKSIARRVLRKPLAIAPAADQTGEYKNFGGGNRLSGKALFYAACHSCHPNANRFKAGKFMPFFGADRLSNEQIRDIIAYLKSLPPGKSASQ